MNCGHPRLLTWLASGWELYMSGSSDTPILPPVSNGSSEEPSVAPSTLRWYKAPYRPGVLFLHFSVEEWYVAFMFLMNLLCFYLSW